MPIKSSVFALILFLFFSLGQAANNNPGIAFVHGTSDHRTDAFGDYWKIDHVESIANALPNPENYFIVHCDYSKFMWNEEAGGCTSNQLVQFIKEKKITSLTVYTHSNGGNIMRWILSNPTYNKKHMILKEKITQVIALAPSSAGTPLADFILKGPVFGINLAWFMGYESDAAKQQRIGDMQIYNEELLFGTKERPDLPLPFKVIVGTEVSASPFSAASYCNGYLLNLGLKITNLYLDDCADGFLNCSSQEAAGDVWFYDKEQLEDHNGLTHNQSRHSCFGLGEILRSALIKEAMRK
jgi:hypothetical protein